MQLSTGNFRYSKSHDNNERIGNHHCSDAIVCTSLTLQHSRNTVKLQHALLTNALLATNF
jgi:hypothetical protein